MPFEQGFRLYPWAEALLKIRQKPWQAYGIAIILVALAISARWAIAEQLGPRTPFITLYPAIILAAVLGGLGPGIVATMLSTLGAWHFFFLPSEGGGTDVWQVATFLCVSALNVTVAVALHKIVDRLLLQQRNIRLLLDTAPNGFLLVDRTGAIKLANRSTARLFGYGQAEELAGKTVEALVPGPIQERHANLRVAYQKAPEARAMGAGRDLHGQRKDGTEFPVEIGLTPIEQNGNGAVLATIIDITSRKRGEEHQKLLIRELQHRTANLFAVFQALLNTSARGAQSVDELVRQLGDRLRALSRTYALFSSSPDGVAFHELLQSHVGAHESRVHVEGDDVVLQQKVAEQLGLVIHELATNALKHGSLSAADGRIEITSRLHNGSIFSFAWQEQGGPVVTPPMRVGFGSMILRDMARQFASRVVSDYQPSGLRYELELNLPEQPAAKAHLAESA